MSTHGSFSCFDDLPRFLFLANDICKVPEGVVSKLRLVLDEFGHPGIQIIIVDNSD